MIRKYGIVKEIDTAGPDGPVVFRYVLAVVFFAEEGDSSWYPWAYHSVELAWYDDEIMGTLAEQDMVEELNAIAIDLNQRAVVWPFLSDIGMFEGEQTENLDISGISIQKCTGRLSLHDSEGREIENLIASNSTDIFDAIPLIMKEAGRYKSQV